MGQEAKCVLRYRGRTSQGTVSLEHKDLVFRGDERLRVPLASVTSATAGDGRLVITFGGDRVEFDIGSAAAKWADRITNPPSRLDKLGIKAGMAVAFIDFRDSHLTSEIRRRGARVVRRATAGSADAVFYGANRREELAGISRAAALLQPAGALWIVRPKGSKDISEAETMAAGKRAGLVDVKVVSFSDTHTAEKFVIPVSKRAKPSRVSPRRGRS